MLLTIDESDGGILEVMYNEIPLTGQQRLSIHQRTLSPTTTEEKLTDAPILKFPWRKKTKSKSIVYNMYLKYSGFCVILRVAKSRRANPLS